MADFSIFGFQILKDKKQQNQIQTVVTPTSDDGSVVLSSSAAAYYAQTVDMDTSIKSENELIRRYREVSLMPECDAAIEEIVNEAICVDDKGEVATLNLEELKVSDGIKKKIQNEFEEVKYLIDFDVKAHDLFRSWYVDGRQYHIISVDASKPKQGILKIDMVDSRKIRKVKKVEKTKDVKTGVDVVKSVEEFYLYNERGIETSSTTGIKLSLDSVVYVPSGLYDQNSQMMFSYLHKAVKPVNHLKMLEDAVVINTMARAPERRIFYIDVGNLPKLKAEQYVTDIMNKYRNKVVYDASTGEVRDDRKFQSMLEDFWMPRRDGCFTLDTKVPLLDGRSLEIGQLIVEHKSGKTNWVYSVSPTGKVVPGKISWAGVTRLDSQILEVHLDNGEVVRCTPDHKFILRTGEKVEAKNLVPGSSLMPFNTKTKEIAGKHYKQVQHNDNESFQFVHRMVSEYMNEDFDPSHHVRHVDYDRNNNNPDNLWRMTKQDHLDLHVAQAKRNWELGDRDLHIKRLSDSGKKFFESEAGSRRKEQISEFNRSSEIIWSALKTGRQVIKQMREEDKAILSKEEYLEKWSPGLKKASALGAAAAAEKLKALRSSMTDEEYKKYCKDNFSGSTKRMKKSHSMISLDVIIATIKNEVEKNIHISNEDLVNVISQIYPGITLKKLRKYLSVNGYESISDVIARNCDKKFLSKKREAAVTSYTNHKVTKVVWCDEKEDVGTLTIDEHHEYHDYHNFAIDSGIFVMNSKGTEITTLPGSGQLIDNDMIAYFQQKLYQALNVPLGRLQPQQGFSLGRSNEITRDELKFNKFVNRLRNRFSQLLIDLLRVQLIAKNIVTVEDWREIEKKISIEFVNDNNFVEMRDSELWMNRLQMLQQIQPFVGTYFGADWVKREILRLSENEIKDLEKEVEATDPKFLPPEHPDSPQNDFQNK